VTYCGDEKVVNMRNAGMRGRESAHSSKSKAKPSGNLRSTKAMSITRSRMASLASLIDAALLTTSISSHGPKAASKPPITTGWSSTRSTWITYNSHFTQISVPWPCLDFRMRTAPIDSARRRIDDKPSRPSRAARNSRPGSMPWPSSASV